MGKNSSKRSLDEQIEQKELEIFLASWIGGLACDPCIKDLKFSVKSYIACPNFPMSLLTQSMRYSGSTDLTLMSPPLLGAEFLPLLEKLC